MLVSCPSEIGPCGLGAATRMLPFSHLPLTEYSSPLARPEHSLPACPLNKQSRLSSTWSRLEIWDLRDPGRPLWAGGDQPPDRHLTS